MEDYKLIIEKINQKIENFSTFLNPKYALPQFNESRLLNPIFSWKLKEVGWHDTMFPGDESPGVYFIFGRSIDNIDDIGVYVGKASFNNIIGKRLYSHLYHGKDDMNYTMKDKNGNTFLLDFVTTIPMQESSFFATALEEFLISSMQDENIYLLNAVGKY